MSFLGEFIGTMLLIVFGGGVVSRTRSSERDAVSEMKEDPSEPAYRSRLQTTVSCCRPMAVVVNVTEKAQLDCVMCGLERRMQVNH